MRITIKQTNNQKLVELTKKSTFIDVASIWLEKIKKGIKDQSYFKYANIIEKHLKTSSLANISISRLTSEKIATFLKEKEKSGKLSGQGGLAPSTIKTIIYIIRATIQFAVSTKLCKPLDLTEIKCKDKEKRQIVVLGKQDQIILEKYLLSRLNIRKLGIIICLYTGLRIGEVCGLMWENIDLKNKQISIVRTVQRIKNMDPSTANKTKLICSTPKSQTSKRVLPLPDFLIPLLSTYKKESDYFLLSQKKSPMEPRVYEYFFVRLLKKCSINHVKFHVLRHTFATRAIESGMDIKSLSELLGHASVDVTLSIYVHSSIELKRKSIENLVSFMNQ